MKRLFIALFLLIVASQGIFAQNREVLSFDKGRTTMTKEIQLQSSMANGLGINAELLLHYESSTRELTLRVTPSSGSYNKVFIPMKVYGRKSLKYAVRRELNGKTKLNKPYKKRLAYGIGPSISVSGATIIDAINSGMSNELLNVGEMLVLHLRVDNPDKAITIKMNSLSAVKVDTTAFRKTRYCFSYMADETWFEVTMPVEPCKLEEMKQLQSEAQALYNEINETHRELGLAVGKKEKSKCEECKEKFKNDYPQQLSNLRNRYTNIGAVCKTVDKYFENIEIVFQDAEILKCSGGVPPPPECPSSIAKTIKDEVKKLDAVVDRIAAGKDVSNSKSEGESLIIRIEERISRLGEKCKNKPEFKSAINSFESTKQSFKKL